TPKNMFALRTGIIIIRHRADTRRIISASRSSRRNRVGTGNKATGYQDGPWRPALIINLADPVQKLDQIADFFFAQILLRHQPTMFILIIKLSGIAHVSLEIRFTTMLGNFGQIRCVISLFTEERMAINTIVLVPYIFAVSDFGRDIFRIGQGVKLTVTI